MEAHEYKHTWTFDRDSKLIRFYLWLWDADVEKTDFCRLFWGYIFAPVGLLFRAILVLIVVLFAPVWMPIAWLVKRAEERKARLAVEPPKPPPPPKPKRDMPGKIALFFARPGPRRVAKLIGMAFVVVAGLTVIAAAIYGLVLVPWDAVWDVLPIALLAVGASGCLAALMYGCHQAMVLIENRFGLTRRWRIRKERREKEPKKDKGPGLGTVLVEGAIAVKANTCPRIEIRSEG